MTEVKKRASFGRKTVEKAAKNKTQQHKNKDKPFLTNIP